ncbi:MULTISPECIES: acyl-ACP thioesterase domain-containing protein [unclassified Rhodococcus (in: high G+C Gram-positive bacteria)]|jgi:acyl-ACP thioesterase|uniref:acyl-[acyl-carrier-protein] thioesterase n=2 Tax=unclassified Rhodococcus (in: high G+C Gram-positive bacteria) TaxID=192944 RepID=UPI0009E6E16D
MSTMDLSPVTSHELAPQPPTGEGFETAWPIRAGDVDTANRLRYDSVARYLQDIGSDNLDASGLGETDPFWIVRRTIMDIDRPSVWPERITLRRWCSGLSTRWSNMRVDITGDKGAHIRTEGFWISISSTTGMPTRISDEGLALLTRTAGETRLKWKQWLRDPAPESSLTDLAFPLRITDVDAFNHVNNAAYWQAVEEVLARAESGEITGGPHRAVIEYLSPIMAPDHVTLRWRRHDVDGAPAVTVWFMVDDAVRTIACVVARAGASGVSAPLAD